MDVVVEGLDCNVGTRKITFTPNVFVKRKTKNKNNKDSKEETKETKECPKRVECLKWFIQPTLLEHDTQLGVIEGASKLEQDDEGPFSLFKQQIEQKLYGYKHQDIKKNMFCAEKFITFSQTIELLNSCALICAYCDVKVLVLYENVREPIQWSLDRVDNNAGHNADNLLIACLKCNLKRRRINMDSFMFTRKMKLVKGA